MEQETNQPINLFDEKNACILCSGSYVKRIYPISDQLRHALAHLKQGNAIVIQPGRILVNTLATDNEKGVWKRK